jgi:spermidine/putrescine-binding protein
MSKFFERLKKANVLKVNSSGLVQIRGVNPNLSRRNFNVGVVASGAAIATVGLGSASAIAAEQVNYMGWQGFEDPFNAGDFAVNNDINLNITYQTDNSHAIAVAKGGGLGNMDIVTPDYAYTAFMEQVGILQPIDMSRVPNYDRLFDRFRSLEGGKVDGVQYSLPLSWGSIPLMYNTEFVKETPTSWHDLFKEEYKGRVAVTNDVISVMVAFALAATGTKTPTRINRDELDATLALLIKFKKEHARTIAPGYGELTDLFATGEIWMAQSWEPVANWSGLSSLKWVTPKEGTHSLTDCLAIVKDAPHLDAVYKLLNQGMSAEGQAYMGNRNAVGVTNQDAVALLDDAVRTMYPYDNIEAFFESTGGGPFPLWPLEREGDIVSMDDVLAAWDDFLKA